MFSAKNADTVALSSVTTKRKEYATDAKKGGAFSLMFLFLLSCPVEDTLLDLRLFFLGVDTAETTFVEEEEETFLAG